MQEIVKIDQAVLDLVIASFGEGGLPKPFVQEIFLIECHIAGTTYCDLKSVEPELNSGDTLIFRREPDNKFDILAVMILNKLGIKLGYLPQDRNEVISRLMDAGKFIFGILHGKSWQGNWLKLDIKVYLRD